MSVYEPTPDEVARFWSYIDSSGGPDACWPWLRGKDWKRYGIFWAGKSVRAHRLSYALAHKLTIVPSDLKVMHDPCNNPPCCNPAHLILGTDEDNMAERTASRRSALGERNGAAKLTSNQVLEIRARFRDGESASGGLAFDFGVSPTLVRMIGRGMIWKHVKEPEVSFDPAALNAMGPVDGSSR